MSCNHEHEASSLLGIRVRSGRGLKTIQSSFISPVDVPLETEDVFFFFPQTLAKRIKRVTMSFNTMTSKYIFQNGQYVGEYYKKSKLFMAGTVKGRSVYHTVEELIVIVQGYYQVSTYKLVMKEKHFNSNLINIFDSLTYRVFRNVETSPPTGRVEEIGANLHSE